MDKKIENTLVQRVMTALTSLLLIATALTALPSQAIADEYSELSEMVEQSKAIKADMEAVQSEYLAAVQKAAESEREAQNAREELSRVQESLNAQQEKLCSIARESYKRTNGVDYIQVIVESNNVIEMLRKFEYINTIIEQRQETVREVMRLEAEAAELPEKLAEEKSQAEELAEAATTTQEVFQSKLASIKQKMQPYKAAYSERIAGLSGSAQMNEILSYLENVEECTEEQVAIIQSAYRLTGSGGYNQRCEAFAEAVVRNAGFDMPSYISAWDDCKANMISSDISEVKAGCLVFAAGSGYMGNLYGHVGICVYANGNPNDVRICDSVSASGTSQTLAEWLSWQTSVNTETGATGLFGWGYPPGLYW